MANVETEGFEEAQSSVARLAGRLNNQLTEDIDDEVDALRTLIQTQIKRKGLIESGDLMASFKVERIGTKEWQVYSTEEHAAHLEFGTTDHTIRPDDADVLAWEPENPADYPDHYDEETGYVYMSVVDHPGNDEYKFVRDAQRAWGAKLSLSLRAAVIEQIYKSGFSLK